MKIAIGNDHTAIELKEHIVKYLRDKGYDVTDFGTNEHKRTDYPLYGYTVGRKVASGEFEYGILICGTGIGISLAANKIHGVRAASVTVEEGVALGQLFVEYYLRVFKTHFFQ